MRISDWSSDVCSSDLFQDLVGGGPAVSCELRGDHAALRGAAGVERLRHGAEVLAQSRRLAAGDGERALQRFAIEAHEATGGGSGSEGAAGRGRVEVGDRKSTRLNSSH